MDRAIVSAMFHLRITKKKTLQKCISKYGHEFDLTTVQPLLLYLQRYIIGEASNKNHSSIVFEQP
jgi:hypothetical protein